MFIPLNYSWCVHAILRNLEIFSHSGTYIPNWKDCCSDLPGFFLIITNMYSTLQNSRFSLRTFCDAPLLSAKSWTDLTQGSSLRAGNNVFNSQPLPTGEQNVCIRCWRVKKLEETKPVAVGNYFQTLNKETQAGCCGQRLTRLDFWIRRRNKSVLFVFFWWMWVTNQWSVPVRYADEERLGPTVTAVHFWDVVLTLTLTLEGNFQYQATSSA